MTATAQGVSDAPQAAGDAPNLTPPPGNPRFPLVDSLRAIAALCVFAGHTVTQTTSFVRNPGPFEWAVQLAGQGVAIFFLISGFLLYRPFLTARRNGSTLGVASYAQRRILRIVPAYWAALSIFLAAGLVSGVTTSNWWIFYGFGQIYSSSTSAHGIGVAWTLCIEMSFYALLPLFVILAGRLGRSREDVRPDMLLLVVLAAASLAFRAHYGSFLQSDIVSTLPGTFTWFALGMALALCSVTRSGSDLRSRLPSSWPVMSWLGAVLTFVGLHEVSAHSRGLGSAATSVITHVLFGLAALLILLPGVFEHDAGGLARRALRSRPLAWIGLVSYGVFLYHTIVLAQIEKLVRHASLGWRYPIVTVLGLLVTLACAAASYYLLERPLMRLGRGRSPRVLSRLWRL